eukprot:scaffold944_cov333-Pavlova_lutheri.AAC.18
MDKRLDGSGTRRCLCGFDSTDSLTPIQHPMCRTCELFGSEPPSLHAGGSRSFSRTGRRNSQRVCVCPGPRSLGASHLGHDGEGVVSSQPNVAPEVDSSRRGGRDEFTTVCCA